MAADSIYFAKVITFEDQASGFGPGRPFADVIWMDGIAFGEHFAGQSMGAVGNFDRVTGQATGPLTLRPGAPAQNLTIIRLPQTNVLSGYGPTGYPNHTATGEGAIALLFDHDQPIVGFDLRGGEGGFATLGFLTRDGTVIDTHIVGPLAEKSYAFARRDQQADIAGLIITNEDPDGIALDTVSFESVDQSS
ncbi:hypothetical protein [Yoonia sp. SS1-5]|uniref:Phytase-like domain-containing protein n=1 Tax=Yoonia rhodophyticola TaxID=3137370 RepID=A0AAN0MC36_9RHOB